MTTNQLHDDVAIVTGAGRNIGKAIAETFADHGANVVVADLDADRAEQTTNDINQDGGESIPVTVDISQEDDVTDLIETTEAEYGPVDILVNNAAITERTPFLDLEMEEFDRIVDVNLRGTFIVTREAARSMKQSGGGRIVHMASTSAHVARPNAVAYAATKRGVLSYTKSMANALAEHNIRVNAISPTRTGSRVGANQVRTGESDPDILVGRWGEPQDQADAALFLVSEQSDFITGTELVVDGGAMASSY
jgi:NAD(P)-dependent dehydrogenase (short-subunit alcohol dehydrogenase family)